MEKHLVLLDLDGTLLLKDSTISEQNKQAIKKTRELGHEVIIVTGRAHYRSNWYYDELGLDTVFFNRNGGHIHHPNDKGFEEIIDIIGKKTIEIIMESDISQYFDNLVFENKNNILVLRGGNDYYVRNDFKLVKLFDLNDYRTDLDINLISFFVNNKYFDKVVGFLNTIDEIGLELFKSPSEDRSSFIQIYPKGTNKKKSIKWLSDYYGVPVNRVIAMGDGGNDIEMIKHAGIGIAMANAIDEVKSVANIQLDKTNNESGVGHFLSKYFHFDLDI